MQKYTFIHIPQNGGHTIKHYVTKNNINNLICHDTNHPINYRLPRKTVGQIHHSLVCEKYINPIIVWRDPIERFEQLYIHWKNTTTHWMTIRAKKILENELTIDNFISLFSSSEKAYYFNPGLWEVHFLPQSFWLGNCPLNDIIIIKHNPNLLLSFQKIISHKNNKELKKTENTKKRIVLEPHHLTFIRDFYKKDFEIYNMMHKTPSAFKKVVL